MPCLLLPLAAAGMVEGGKDEANDEQQSRSQPVPGLASPCTPPVNNHEALNALVAAVEQYASSEESESDEEDEEAEKKNLKKRASEEQSGRNTKRKKSRYQEFRRNGDIVTVVGEYRTWWGISCLAHKLRV